MEEYPVSSQYARAYKGFIFKNITYRRTVGLNSMGFLS